MIKRGINSAYFDFDDTIIVNGMANDKVIQSILDLHDKGIPIKILTRNSNDLTEKLVSLHLNDVVGEVIYVPALDKKSLYIFTNEPFLFVDDSHRERLDVHNQFLRLGVVLDPSAFENKIVFES
jgi:hypothetical protein